MIPVNSNCDLMRLILHDGTPNADRFIISNAD